MTEPDDTSTAAASAPPPDSSFEDQERSVGIDPDAPLPGEEGLRIILFGAIALFGIPAVLGGGIAAGYPVDRHRARGRAGRHLPVVRQADATGR